MNSKDIIVAGFELIPRFNSGRGGVSLIFPKRTRNELVTADTITNDQLRDLFAKHCECRPLDLARIESDHAAIHDCDTGTLHDVQLALNIVRFDDIGRIQAMHQARERCAEVINDQEIPSSGELLTLDKAQELAFALLKAVDLAANREPMPWAQLTKDEVKKADYSAQMAQYYAQRDDERSGGSDDGDE